MNYCYLSMFVYTNVVVFQHFLFTQMKKKESIKEEVRVKSLDTLVRAFVFALGIFMIALIVLGLVYWFSNGRVSQDAVHVVAVETDSRATVTPEAVVEEKSVYTKIPATNSSNTEPSVAKSSNVETSIDTLGQNYEYGISLGATLSYMSEEEVKAVLDDLVSLNIGWIRCDLSWNSIQNQNEEAFNWSSFDRIVRLAYERGIEVLPILTYTPVWARSEECKYTSKCPPADAALFADFARRAVERYESQGVDTWEVWNEPNIAKFWAGGVSAYEYTQLLRSTYRAIHAADAGATVVSGGLAPASSNGTNIEPREYLERMYESGVQGFFDVLGFHPYSFPLSPENAASGNAWTQMSESSWSLRSIMKENGDGGKELWVTEFGAPTGGPGKAADGKSTFSWTRPTFVTEEFQAEIFLQAYSYKEEHEWMGPLFWYSYKDLGVSDDTIENHFGILEYDGARKDVYEVMEQVL